jgi:uncharacterized membrane protein
VGRPDLNRLISVVLWGGLLLSVATILAGLLSQGVQLGAWPRTPVSPGLLLGQVLQLTPDGLLSLGVFFMILTPIARVLLSIFVFLDETDWLYVFITFIVFVNLMVGVVIGLL